jgi:hypothetical protein
MVNFLGITSSIASEWTNFRQGYKLDGALEVRLESIEYQEAIRSVTEGRIVGVEKLKKLSNAEGEYGWDAHTIWVRNGVSGCELEPHSRKGCLLIAVCHAATLRTAAPRGLLGLPC